MQRLVVVFRLIVLCGLLMACRTPLAHGTEIYIPPLSAASGSTVQVPVMIDEVGNLAGIKLVMRYDPALLTFKRGAKTSHTDSLMHIINSKNPGVLILVMAGARGIKGGALSPRHAHVRGVGGPERKTVHAHLDHGKSVDERHITCYSGNGKGASSGIDTVSFIHPNPGGLVPLTESVFAHSNRSGVRSP